MLVPWAPGSPKRNAQGGWVTYPRALPSSCQLPMLSLHRAEQGLIAAIRLLSPPILLLHGMGCFRDGLAYSHHTDIHRTQIYNSR